MRPCRSTLSLAAWAGGLNIRSDAVEQVLQQRNARKDGGRAAPVRCVVARRAICRGERLCVVPESHILHGGTAVTVLQRAAAQGCVANYTELQRHLVNVRGDPHLLSTRDALLIVLALHVLRYGGVRHPLAEWVACLPPRVPPMGLLLLQRVAPAPFAPLQRQLRLGDHTAALPPDGASAPEAAVELMLQAAEQHGIAHIGRPQAEVAASQELMTAFYSGTRHPLTQRQHEAAGAQHRHAESEAARQLLKHEEFLHNAVLKPLLVCIPPMRCETDSNAGTEASARTMEELRWSHFMVRSRALNLHPWCPQQPQMAVVPFLDMLNHTARNPNVTYQYRPGEGVIVVASRPIKGAEELALNYGDYRQRGCLFSSAAEQATTSESIASTMRRIELRQAREWDTAAHADSGDEEDNIEEAPFGHGLQQQKQENEQQHSYKEHQAPSEGGRGEGNENEARTEAVWTWRFGFPRSDDEKAYVASRLWSKGLKRRIAQLTDVRRRGRPGEFVIGVPEGLRHLREQRERLERERFAGATVFPPQNV